MELVDTHCHLDIDAFDPDRTAVIERARAAGVGQLVIVGFEPERWGTSLALADSQPGMYASVGLHPTEAERYNLDLEHQLRLMARAPRVRAIGEIGLDYHWQTASPEAQRRAFTAQIALAKELGLPFIVHMRKAAADTLEVLRAAGPPHSGVMHCFTEDWAYAEAFLDLGLHLGLGGAITYRNNRALHEVAARAPLDRIVLETDAPYMAPTPYRGQRNEPAHLRLVAERLSDLRGLPVGEIAAATTATARALFRLGEERMP